MRFPSVAAWLVSWEVQVPFVLVPGFPPAPAAPRMSNQVAGEKEALIGSPAFVGGAYYGLGRRTGRRGWSFPGG